MNQNKEEEAVDITKPAMKIPRYRRLRRFFIALATFVSLMPLLIMTVFYYHLDQTALQAETHYNVSQILSNTKRTLEFIIKERLSALTLLVNQEKYATLDSDEGIVNVFGNLKSSFGGFVDIGLIDSDGVQRHYTGPYNLKGQSYSDQSWFHEVSLRNIHISDVYMGHRNFPHFIIAVKKELPNGDWYVLRASIDLDMLDRQLRESDYNCTFDAFLINRSGILQTKSAEYGILFGNYPPDVPKYAGGREIITQNVEGGVMVTHGYSYIEQSPFILIVRNDCSNPVQNWLTKRRDLVWFLIISSLATLAAILLGSTYMINRIQESDIKRTKLLHNIEYTNKMATIGRMAAGVAHEINNPLAIINEKAGLLKDMVSYKEDFPYKEKVLKTVDSILGSVDRCSKVTHRLLGFGRRMDSRREIIDLEGLINEVLGFIAKEAEHKNIRINVTTTDRVCTIESDRGQLQQVFLNIVNNAFVAVEKGGEIDIMIDSPELHSVSVAIRDNGSGISKQNLKSIFEPFFSTKGEFGTGLGLSITYEIVEKLGGEIDVESTLGEGTMFTVTLPR